MLFVQKCPMVFDSEGPKDTQHYGQVRFRIQTSFQLDFTILQYEESEIEFPNFDLSPVQQSAFEGF